MLIEKQIIEFRADRRIKDRYIDLGNTGDNLVRKLIFVLPEINEIQTASLIYGGLYADVIQLVHEECGWTVELTAELIGEPGEVEGYIRVDSPNGQVWHSDPFRIITGEVPDVTVQIEKLYPTAVDQMLQVITEHTAQMNDAADRAEAAADKAEASGGISPTITVTELTGGHRVTITDVNGTQSFDVFDGKDGGASDGSGADGEDGGYYTPSVVQADHGTMRISYIPSKVGMPDVGTVDINLPAGPTGKDGHTPIKGVDYFDGMDGEDGSSGVHVGNEEPTDADINVWVDPDGAATDTVLYSPQALTDEQKAHARENIGAASQEAVRRISEEVADQFADRYTKAETDSAIGEAVKDGKYELIQDILVNETEIKVIYVDVSKGFKKIKIEAVIEGKEGEANIIFPATVITVSKKGDRFYLNEQKISAGNPMYRRICLEVNNGMFNGTVGYCRNINSSYLTSTIANPYYGTAINDNIQVFETLNIATVTGGYPTGMKITVKGVRADA